MFIKSEPKNMCQSLNSKNGWLQRIAEYLLSLPRSVKRAVLLSTDLVLSLICLFLALSLRHGYLGNHIGLLALCCYAIIPIIGLYAIGFYKGVARGFFDAVMANVSQLFFLLIVLYEVIISFDVFPYMPRSVPIIFLFLFFIWLWNSRLTIRELLTRAQGKNQKRDIDDNDYDNVIIYGAGEAGRELSEGLKNSHKYNVVAYVDDDPQLTGAYLLDKKSMPHLI
ncbi:nucleoside-diphosphate sugar epimerase/dehydratase [Psychrobacter sp. ER1]|uniref:nucleoside-diphosphate sugar epimerase/dehydratase n=1 Tax=Psychrobacter sp. ER1 TaxID=3406645 RepID=UPI003B43C898